MYAEGLCHACLYVIEQQQAICTTTHFLLYVNKLLKSFHEPLPFGLLSLLCLDMKLPVDGTVARSKLQPLPLHAQLALGSAHIKMKTLLSPTASYIAVHVLLLSQPERRLRSSIVP